MDELQAEAEEIRKVVGRRATPERRNVLTQALSSKWESSQVKALKALAAWGDRQSVDAIRHYLIAAFEREYSWSVRGVAIRKLVPIVGVEDADWIMELCRSRSNGLERHELRSLVERVTSLTTR